jgi:DNA-directed RNA polymerase specialized sigma24 family protein
MRHAGNPADAEDALGDACVSFLTSYQGPDGDEALFWMLTVVKRRAWAIKRRRSQSDSLPVGVLGCSDRWSSGHDSVDIIALEEALQLVTADQRSALLLVASGVTYREIERKCGWTTSKVHRCIRDGRARLRQLFEGGAKL